MRYTLILLFALLFAGCGSSSDPAPAPGHTPPPPGPVAQDISVYAGTHTVFFVTQVDSGSAPSAPQGPGSAAAMTITASDTYVATLSGWTNQHVPMTWSSENTWVGTRYDGSDQLTVTIGRDGDHWSIIIREATTTYSRTLTWSSNVFSG